MIHESKKRFPVLGIVLALGAWVLFIVVNSTINQAPQSRDTLSITNGMLFIGLLGIALFLTFWVITRALRRSLLVTILLVGLLTMRLYHVTSLFSVVVLFGIVLGSEFFFLKMHNSSKPASFRPRTDHIPPVE